MNFWSQRPSLACPAAKHTALLDTNPRVLQTRIHISNKYDGGFFNDGSTPLLDAVVERGSRLQDVPFHVPGHKRGRALDDGMQQLLGLNSSNQEPRHVNPLRHDLTELAGLDYLSSPTGVIAEAQQLAAAAFKADHTWFLVNGCSVGIHAAVMATVKPHQTILLARNCHLSAFSACVITGCKPLWLNPEVDEVHGVAHCVTPEELTAAFKAARDQGLSVGAVMVVSPTYYGAVARIQDLADVCHSEGVPLLVDEAHGGHLDFIAQDMRHQQQHKEQRQQQQQQQQQDNNDSSSQGSIVQQDYRLPASALSSGADAVMQSSHKVLTAMTQAAMLHVRGMRVNPDRVSTALQVLQTSSPSYLLLSSLDAARRHATTPGVWTTPLAAAATARRGLMKLSSQYDNVITLLQQGCCGSDDSVAGYDPLRLVVNVRGSGLTGFQAAEWLEQKHSIVPELATEMLVVFVVGPGSTLEDAQALVTAFEALCSQQTAKSTTTTATISSTAHNRTAISGSNSSSTSYLSGTGRQVQQQRQRQHHLAPVSPREAFFADSRCIQLSAAAGHISAELLCPYPPGVPVLFPGEVITADDVQLLQETLAQGGVVTGARDSTLQTVQVLAC